MRSVIRPRLPGLSTPVRPLPDRRWLRVSRKGMEMTDFSSPGPHSDGQHSDASDPDTDRADLADQSPVDLDEDAIRERAEQPDDDTDSVI